MTVGGWLAALGRRPEAAWAELRLVAEKRARRVVPRGGDAEEEAADLASDLVCAVMRTGAAGLRRARRGVLLASWVEGTLRKLHVAERKARRRTLGRTMGEERLLEGGGEAVPARVRFSAPNLSEADRSVLTRGQREIYELFWDRGMSIREIRKRLGLHWRTVHERLQRGLRRLRDGAPPPPPSREWAAKAAKRSDLEAGTRGLLARFAGGESYARIASAVGGTENAVRLRIRRLKEAVASGRPPRRRGASRPPPPPRGTYLCASRSRA